MQFTLKQNSWIFLVTKFLGGCWINIIGFYTLPMQMINCMLSFWTQRTNAMEFIYCALEICSINWLMLMLMPWLIACKCVYLMLVISLEWRFNGYSELFNLASTHHLARHWEIINVFVSNSNENSCTFPTQFTVHPFHHAKLAHLIYQVVSVAGQLKYVHCIHIRNECVGKVFSGISTTLRCRRNIPSIYFIAK